MGKKNLCTMKKIITFLSLMLFLTKPVWAQPAQVNEFSHLGTQWVEILYDNTQINNLDLKIHCYDGSGNFITTHDYNGISSTNVGDNRSITCKVVTELGPSNGAILLTDETETVVWQALAYGAGSVVIVDGPPIGIGETAIDVGISENTDPSNNQSLQDLTDLGGMNFVISTETCGQLNFEQVLPVELSSFTVKTYHGNSALLQWTTASEVNADYAEVQVSYDAIGWNTSDKVPFKGNSTTVNYYQSRVKNLSIGFHYFRLKMVDFDKSYEYSDVIAVKIEDIDLTHDYSVIRTSESEFYIELDGDEFAPRLFQAWVYNINGQPVGLVKSEIGLNRYTVKLPDQGGMYFVKFRINGYTGEKFETVKLVVPQM